MYSFDDKTYMAERIHSGRLCPIPDYLKIPSRYIPGRITPGSCNNTGTYCRPIYGEVIKECPCHMMPKSSVVSIFWTYIHQEELGDCAMPYSTV